MPTKIYQLRNGVFHDVSVPGEGAPPSVATCSANGIFRPDCDTIRIDGDGVLRMDIAAIAREIAEAIKPAPPEPEQEQPPVQLPVVASIVNMGVTAGNPANFLCSWSPRNNGTDVLEMEFAADGAFANVLHRRDALVDSVATGITPVPASIWETFPRDVLHVRARVKTPDGEGQWFATTINTSSWPFPAPTRHGEIIRDPEGNDVAVIIGSHESDGREPWNIFGRKTWIAVGLAETRTAAAFGWNEGSNKTIPGLDIVSRDNMHMGRAADSTEDYPDGTYITDFTTEAHINESFAGDSQDSTRKTDILVSNTAKNPEAALAARKIRMVVDGVTRNADLPRVSVLARIIQSTAEIDRLDTTKGNAADRTLASFTSGRAWSSTQYVMSGDKAIANSTWYVARSRDCYGGQRDNVLLVIPCLEIPAN